MFIAFIAAFALQVVITQVGGALFDTVALGAVDWLKIVALALSVVALDELVKLGARLVKRGKANKSARVKA